MHNSAPILSCLETQMLQALAIVPIPSNSYSYSYHQLSQNFFRNKGFHSPVSGFAGCLFSILSGISSGVLAPRQDDVSSLLVQIHKDSQYKYVNQSQLSAFILPFLYALIQRSMLEIG